MIEALSNTMIFFIIFFIVLFVFLVAVLVNATYLVRQAEVIIVERFGSYYRTLGSGIHIIVPFVDQPRKVLWTFMREDSKGKLSYRFTDYVERIDLREAVFDFPKQSVITKDNVTIDLNALLYYQITDPIASIYEVANLPQAIEKLAQTTMRNIIGSMDLDQTLASRDSINEKIRVVLDEATDKWGIKVNRVELQELTPPLDIREAMEKQMRAERDRRAVILEAEGKKAARILEAEGYYQWQITQAKGEAEARLLIAQAESEAIQKIQRAVPEQNALAYLIAQNYLKVLPEIMRDKTGKVILMPYESSALMGSLGTIKELFTGGHINK